MDNQRLLIWALFGFMLFLTWQAWVEDYGPQPTPAAASEQSVEPLIEPVENGLPELPAAAAETPDIASPEDPAPATTTDTAAHRLVVIETDVLELGLSTQGGTLQYALLKNYPVAKDRPDELVELLSPDRAELGLLQFGLRSAGETHIEPNHLVTFSANAERYELAGDDELIVPLTWSDGTGLRVERNYRLTRGSYVIEVEQRLVNASPEEWRGAAYAQIRRRSHEPERSMFDVDTYSFDGPIVYDGDKSEKLDRDDLMSDGPFRFRATEGWIATIQHHFLSAIVPPRGVEQSYNVGPCVTAWQP